MSYGWVAVTARGEPIAMSHDLTIFAEVEDVWPDDVMIRRVRNAEEWDRINAERSRLDAMAEATDMKIRAYQARAVEEIAQAMREGCRSLVYSLSTGGGKTVIASELIRRAYGKTRRQLFVVHRRELVRQAFDALTDILGAGEVGVIAAGWPPCPWAMTQVSSIQTLIRRLHLMPEFDVIYFDEVHHARASTWQKVIERWPRCYKVGLTATPERLDGKGLGLNFEQLIQGPDDPTLTAGGWLAPIDTVRVSAPTELRRGRARKASDGARDGGGGRGGPLSPLCPGEEVHLLRAQAFAVRGRGRRGAEAWVQGRARRRRFSDD